MLAADTLEALGIKRGDYVIKVNNRKVLDGVLEVVGLSGPENDAKWLTAMRALDKFDRLGGDEVSKLLGKGRKDDSGDFTPGANLDPSAINRHPCLHRMERAAVGRRKHRWKYRCHSGKLSHDGRRLRGRLSRCRSSWSKSPN